MKLAVVFTAFSRPAYLTRVLRAWEAVRGLDTVDLHFQVEPGYPQVAEMCREFAAKHGGLVRVNPQRLGVQMNPRIAIDNAFTGLAADFVILAEDDLLVSPGVLEYFRFAAAAFERRPDVLAASAFQILAPPEAELGGVLVDKFFPGQVWGTWSNRWGHTLYPSWNLSGWDLHINRELVGRQGYRIAMPNFSHSQHIGAFGQFMSPAMLEPGQSKCFVSDMPSVTYHVTADDPGTRFPGTRSPRDASVPRPG